ncbi:MAG: hypothetical protein GY950_31130 [bacterium]|nr:hypothetical protein [bacterium]
MSINQVPLYFAPGSRWAGLRELCGSDEQSVSGTGTIDAIRLLDRLLVAEPGVPVDGPGVPVDGPGTAVGPGKAKELTAADRDRVLAAIYMHTYGSRIKSSFNCSSCDAPLDIDFSLEDVLESLHTGTGIDNTIAEKGPDGTFKLGNGLHFRLPTGEDECEVLGMLPQEAEAALLARCILDGGSKAKQKKLQDTMRDIAPLLDMDLDLNCSECQTLQRVHFDIQSYLLTTIKLEQKQFVVEVHRLACAYGWGLNEILGLSRSSRKAFVALVESELGYRQGIQP